MKTVGVLSFILLAMAMASADEYTDTARSGSAEDTKAIPQPATNPANVIFRTIQAPSTIARSNQQYILQPAVHQHPVSFFSQPIYQQPAPVLTRVVQQAVQPALTRTVIQPAIQQFSAQPVAEAEPYDSNPSYSYGYEINSADSSVYTGHKESRNNNEVTGEYRVLDPNGDLRITRYTAGANGYNAEVEIQKGAGPVYQHLVRKDNEAQVVTRPFVPAQTVQVVTRPAPAPAPVSAASAEDSSEKKGSFVDANVLNLNRGTFFQSAPVAAAPTASAGVQYAYVAVPQQSQGLRFFNAAPQQSHQGIRFFNAVPQQSHQGLRFFNAGNQYLTNNQPSYVRAVPLTAAPATAPAATVFSAGTSYNPYSYIRALPLGGAVAQAPAASAFSSGTTFTKIVHADGTTVEY